MFLSDDRKKGLMGDLYRLRADLFVYYRIETRKYKKQKMPRACVNLSHFFPKGVSDPGRWTRSRAFVIETSQAMDHTSKAMFSHTIDKV